MGEVVALVGAQYGSEGKGVIAAGLAKSEDYRAAVRVGGPNAGHSFWHEGQVWKMRSLPCAWVNPYTELLIGAGAVVNPYLLEREVLTTGRRVVVDPQAVLVTTEMEAAESGIVESIGSTGEGVGQARIAKIGRDGAPLAGTYGWSRDVEVADVAMRIGQALAVPGRVMLEGTQGSGLSLHHGHYPFVTSSDTNVAALLSEAGVAPAHLAHTHLVARTFPIRVGGPSGPFGASSVELAWGSFPGVQPERTTVTNRIRRIATWDEEVFRRAVLLNDPCGVWLMFGDYLDSGVRGSVDWGEVMASGPVRDRVREVERHGVPVLGVGTGGEGWQVAMDMAECSHGVSFLW